MVSSGVKGVQVVEIGCSLRNLNTYCISVYIWSKIYCYEWMGLLTGTCNTSPPDKIGISRLLSSTQLGFLHIPGARWWGSVRWKRKNKYWYKTCMNWIKRFEGCRLTDMLATGQAIQHKLDAAWPGRLGMVRHWTHISEAEVWSSLYHFP